MRSSPARRYAPSLKNSLAAGSSAIAISSPGAIPGRLDRRHQQLERSLVVVQGRREAALVADPGRQPARAQRALELLVGLRAHPHRLRERARTERRDHELLEVDRVVGVRAAVEHVHHRHRQQVRLLAAQVAPQRLAELGRARAGDRERHAEDRVRTEPGLGVGPVELDEGAVEPLLVAGLPAADRVGDLAVDVLHGAQDALAAERLAAVAQLDGLVLAGRRAGRDRRAAERARLEAHVDLDGGVAAAVEDLAGVDVRDRAHARHRNGRPRVRRPSPSAERRGKLRTRRVTVSPRRCCRCRLRDAEDLPVGVLAVAGRQRLALESLNVRRPSGSRSARRNSAVSSRCAWKLCARSNMWVTNSTLTRLSSSARTTWRAISEPSRSLVEANDSLHSSMQFGRDVVGDLAHAGQLLVELAALHRRRPPRACSG